MCPSQWPNLLNGRRGGTGPCGKEAVQGLDKAEHVAERAPVHLPIGARSCRWCGWGGGEPSPGADVAGASLVPAQMWQGEPVPAQMWVGGAQS